MIEGGGHAVLSPETPVPQLYWAAAACAGLLVVAAAAAVGLLEHLLPAGPTEQAIGEPPARTAER
jgi:hypothetical protein